MTKLYIMLAIMGLVALVVNLLKNKPNAEEEYSYTKRNILTIAEQEFYNKLKEIVADRFYIFPQIHLANLLTVKGDSKNWKRLFNKIIQKSVDFVLIDKNTFETKIVIELDDRTHLQTNRVERDNFVDKSLNKAGIAIIHTREHNIIELVNVLKNII